MKKLVFAFAAVVAVSFASCGNKTAQGAAVDSDSVAVVGWTIVQRFFVFSQKRKFYPFLSLTYYAMKKLSGFLFFCMKTSTIQ